MKKITIPIKGMHCRSCEMLVEDGLKKISGVKSASVDWRGGTAEVHYHEHKPADEKLEEAIRSAGYSVGVEKNKSWINKNPNDYKDLGIAFLFIFGLYFVLNSLGLTNISFGGSLTDPGSLSVVLLIGLTAGFSTCMALVGGLVLGASSRFAEKHPEATVLQKFKPHLSFNLGRIIGFTVLGGILGSIGSVFQLNSFTLGFLTILVGLVMLLMGLQLTEIFPVLNSFKLTLPKFVSRALGIKNEKKEYSHRGSALMGAMTFFLPCGFTQAMQLFAVSTGDSVTGAVVMGTFALGTAPGLLGIGGITAAVKGIFAKRFFKFAGLLVILFSLFNISNGYNLTGWQIGTASGSDGVSLNDPNVSLVDGVQVVKMKEVANGYEPNRFTIKKGVPVKWVITAEAPYSCASSIIVPKLNISERLVLGGNIIEFTPKEPGALKFSCSMGMYTGVFNVVDEKGQSQSNNPAVNSAAQNSAPKNSGGSCGGGGGCSCGGGNKKPVSTDSKPVAAQTIKDAANQEAVQVIKTTYTDAKYIDPSAFKVKAGTKVRFEIDVRDDGVGCGYAITIPELYDNIVPLKAGVPIVMEFTPTAPGTYNITCGMNMIRYGSIIVE